MQFVKGQHEAIISEALFYEVQDVLNGNKRKVATKFVSTDMLPLLGFLECPDCHGMLIGNASRGRHSSYFHYYHYTGTCKCRFKAATINEYFESELLNFLLAPGIGDFYKQVVMDVFQSEHKNGSDERKLIATQIEEQERLLSNALKCFMMEDIDAQDFKAIKSECSEALRILEAKLADMPNKAESMKKIEGLLDIVVQQYSNIQLHYKSANIIEKRKLIGSMYPKISVLTVKGIEPRTLVNRLPLCYKLTGSYKA